MPEPIVRAEEVRKAFGGKVRALDGVGPSFKPGIIYGLPGPNGAGKTTLIRPPAHHPARARLGIGPGRRQGRPRVATRGQATCREAVRRLLLTCSEIDYGFDSLVGIATRQPSLDGWLAGQ